MNSTKNIFKTCSFRQFANRHQRTHRHQMDRETTNRPTVVYGQNFGGTRKSGSDSAASVREAMDGRSTERRTGSSSRNKMANGKMQEATSTVLTSTTQAAANEKTAVIISNTGAPCVDPRMGTALHSVPHFQPSRQPTPSTPPFLLRPQTELPEFRTRLKADAWEELLREADGLEEFPEILDGIRNGFKIGLEHYQLTETFIPENHYSLPHHLEHIRQKRDEEIALGRISRGYIPEELEALVGHFRTAPLSVIEKPGKLCTIINHSYPDRARGIDPAITPHDTSNPIPLDPSTTSINTALKSKKWNCNWGTFLECYLLVAEAPPGTEAAVFDVDTAFQNIPLHPSTWPFLAFMIDALIHLDMCSNFGASSSPGLWSRVAQAMAKILLHKGVQALVHWVNDFIFFRFPKKHVKNEPPQFSYDASLIWQVAETLGWPWAIKKFVDFKAYFRYIRFDWSIANKTVELPQEKKEKYHGKLINWVEGKKHTRDEAESIIG